MRYSVDDEDGLDGVWVPNPEGNRFGCFGGCDSVGWANHVIDGQPHSGHSSMSQDDALEAALWHDSITEKPQPLFHIRQPFSRERPGFAREIGRHPGRAPEQPPRLPVGRMRIMLVELYGSALGFGL